MPRRAATVTQAEVARSIRAALAAGLKIVRVVTRPDGVSIETTDDDFPNSPESEPKKGVVL